MAIDAQTLNDVMDAFVRAIEGGTATLEAFALPLLVVLGIIAYYVQYGPQLAVEGRGGDALAGFLLLIVKIGIFEWIVLNLPRMASAAYDTFVLWGGSAGGGTIDPRELNPGEVLQQGFRIGRPIRAFTDNLTSWAAVWDWPMLITYSFAYYAIIIGFGALALTLILIKIEFAFAVLLATVLVPWGVLGATAFVGELSIGWITGGLVRVLLTGAIVGIAKPLFSVLQFNTSEGGDPTMYTAILCGLLSIIFAILAWVIPRSAAQMVGRSLGLSASTLVSGASIVVSSVTSAVRGVSSLVPRRR
jgi:type IV secretion system protein TrbL